MPRNRQKASEPWNLPWAMILITGCLIGGIGGGWLIGGWRQAAVAEPAQAANIPAPQENQGVPDSRITDPARLKEMVDAGAAPLLARLSSDPNNGEVLARIGNLYYDAQQYSAATDYYGRALKVRPADVSVRTDRGTALWYLGNADAALAEFNQALTYQPNNPDTLFNLGIVLWQGKGDAAGAVAAWERLLAANPNYSEKAKVEQLIAAVESRAPAKP